MRKFTIALAAILAMAQSTFASVETDTLENVTVYGERIPSGVTNFSISSAVSELPGSTISDYGVYGEHSFNYNGLGAQHTSVELDGTPVLTSTSGEVDLNQFSPLFSSFTITNDANSAANLSISPEKKNEIYCSYGSYRTINVGGALSKDGFSSYFNHYNTQGFRENSDVQATSVFTKYENKHNNFNFLNYSASYGLAGSQSYPSSTEVYTNQNNRFAYTYHNKFIKNSAQVSQLIWKDNSSAFDDIINYKDSYVRKFTERDIYDKLSASFELSNFKFEPFASFDYTYALANDEAGIDRFTYKGGVGFTYEDSIIKVNFTPNFMYFDENLPINQIRCTMYAGSDHKDFTAFTPYTSFSYSPNNFKLEASYNRSAAVPPIMYVYYGTLSLDKLELVDAFKASLSYSNSNFSVKGTAFYNNLKNHVEYEYDPETWVCNYYNAGSGESYGAIIEGSATIGKTKLSSSYTYTDASVKSGDKYVPMNYVSKSVFNTNIICPIKKVSLGLHHSYHSHFFQGATYMKSYNLFDASVSYTGIKSVEASVICNNILNRDYQLCSGYPMPGRVLTAKMKYSF